jgi:hypothetical protein
MEEGSKSVLKATAPTAAAGSEMVTTVTASFQGESGGKPATASTIGNVGKENAENANNDSRDDSSTTIKVGEIAKSSVNDSGKVGATLQTMELEQVLGSTLAVRNYEKSLKSKSNDEIIQVKADSSSSNDEHVHDSAKPQDMEVEQLPNGLDDYTQQPAKCGEEKNSEVAVDENPVAEAQGNNSSKSDEQTHDSTKQQDLDVEQCPNDASNDALPSAASGEEKNTVAVAVDRHPSAISDSDEKSSLDVTEIHLDIKAKAASSSIKKVHSTQDAAMAQTVEMMVESCPKASDSSSEKCDNKEEKSTVEVSVAFKRISRGK